MVERSVIFSTVFDFLLINEVILVCSNNMMFTITWRRRQVRRLVVARSFQNFQSLLPGAGVSRSSNFGIEKFVKH